MSSEFKHIRLESHEGVSVLALSRAPVNVLHVPMQAPEEQTRLAEAALSNLGDPAFLDVAACLSGVCPPWSGGPLGPGLGGRPATLGAASRVESGRES